MSRILATAAAALLLAAPAWAADQSSASKPSDTPMNQLSMVGADTLTHSNINDASGKKIGKIENVVVDSQTGQVAYAIISANGKDVAVPWQRLHAGNKPETFTLDTTKEALNGAPTVDPKTLAELRGPSDRERVAAFWQNVQSQQAQTPESQGQKSSEGQKSSP